MTHRVVDAPDSSTVQDLLSVAKGACKHLYGPPPTPDQVREIKRAIDRLHLHLSSKESR